MANPFRQRSRLRKLVYFGLILALFTASLLQRRFLIEPEAMALQLREQSRGQVDLTSSAVGLTLTGSRGVATCGLWWIAKEKQKKQEWNELELVVRSITKLQPHFTAPWRFLSWNLAFNVAVECDRARDKYFYISRGLELLAEGERRNQGSTEEGAVHFPGNPDMRYDLGFFYHLKIGMSDDKQYMRCLLDLSCIDPRKREPANFRLAVQKGRQTIKLAEFEDFCRSYPRLVRRLRQHMGRARPAEIIAFLEDNKDVPSRFETASAGSGLPETPLRHVNDQFPILPNPSPLPASLPNPAARDFPFTFDVNQASYAWYLYAQKPLPPPDPDQALHEPVNPDPFRYRLPKMSTIIFRGYPARALFGFAEDLEREGWFDSQQGWTITRWFDEQPGASRGPVLVGTESKYHARPAWERAYAAYLDFGQKNGIYYPPAKLHELEREAQLYRTTYHIEADQGPMTDLRPEYRRGGVGTSFDAHRRLQYRLYAATLTNFAEFLNQSAVEQKTETVNVRKLFFEAREAAARAGRPAAHRKYKEALEHWEDLLMANAGFRRVGEVQIQTYEQQGRYLDLRQKLQGKKLAPLYLGLLRLGQPQSGLSPVVLVLHGLPSAEEAGDQPPPAPSSRKLTLESDPRLIESIMPLRQIQGRFDMLYVFEGFEPPAPALLDFLAGLTQMGSLSPLTVSPYQRDRMLVVWTPAAVPLPTNAAIPSWRPLLSNPAVREVRRMRTMEHTRDTQPAVPKRGPAG
jgi:hypothetical protein